MAEKISVKLEALTQDFNRKMDASNKAIQRVGDQTKKLNTSVASAGKSLNSMKTPVDRATKSLGGLKSVTLLAGIQLAKMAVVAVSQTVKAMDSLVKASFSATNATKLFNRELEVGGHGLKAGQDLVQRLSDKFNVHSSVVEDAATQLLRYGADINAVEGLLTAAGASSLAFGRDVASGFSNVAQAVMSEQSQMLNSIGIAGNLSKAYRDKAKALGTTVDGLTNAQKATAAMTMTMTESAGEIEAVEVLMQGYGGASTRLTEAFTAMKISVGASLESTITDMINFATRIIEKVTLVADAVGDIKTAFQDLLDSPWLTWAKPLFTMLANVGNAIGKLLGLAGWDAYEKSHRNAIEAAQKAPGQEKRAFEGILNTEDSTMADTIATGSMELARSRQNLANELMRTYEASTDPRNKTAGSQRALLAQVTLIRDVLAKGMLDTIARWQDDPSVARPLEKGRFAKQVEESQKLIDALDDLERQVKTNITVMELNALETAKLTTVIDEGAGGGGGGGAGEPLARYRGAPVGAYGQQAFMTSNRVFGLAEGDGGWLRENILSPVVMLVEKVVEEIAAHVETMAFFTSNRSQDKGTKRDPVFVVGARQLGSSEFDIDAQLATITAESFQRRFAAWAPLAADPNRRRGSSQDMGPLSPGDPTVRRGPGERGGPSPYDNRLIFGEQTPMGMHSDIQAAYKAHEERLDKERKAREVIALALERSNQATMGYTMAMADFESTTQQATKSLKQLNESSDKTVNFVSDLAKAIKGTVPGFNALQQMAKSLSGKDAGGLVGGISALIPALSGGLQSFLGPILGGIVGFIGRLFGGRRRRQAPRRRRIVTPWAEDPTPDEMQILSAQTVGRAASQPVLSTVQIQAGQNLLIASQSLQLAADTLLEAVTHRNFAASNALRAS